MAAPPRPSVRAERRRGGLGVGLGSLRQPPLRPQQQRGEQEQERQGRLQVADQLVVLRQVADEEGLADAEDERADEGGGQALHPTHHGGGVGGHHQQAQRVHLEVEAGGDEDGGQAGEHRPERPRRRRDPVRATGP